ncbi:MAG: GNAT family N-acetyltransferase [Rhodospirillales bacterium]|nr:GNAT family N-acetyltransferase [Rhodospirillales bacterium]
MITVREAKGDADMDAIRALFMEYQDWLAVDLCFQGFANELKELPGRYARPAGCLLIADDGGGAVAGGVGMWPLGDDVCEMKRLYVRPPWRGQGLGRRLAEGIVAEARASGNRRMRLDSLRRLQEALTLYRAMGFVDVAPYYDNPLDEVVFMELTLLEPGRPSES